MLLATLGLSAVIRTSSLQLRPGLARTASEPAGSFIIRSLERTDLLPTAALMQESFAGTDRCFLSPRDRSWPDIAITTARLALDIERRATPWDWARHAQLVACAADGELLGFVELWGEDSAALGNFSATTPQPSLFNLCVSQRARETAAFDSVRGGWRAHGSGVWSRRDLGSNGIQPLPCGRPSGSGKRTRAGLRTEVL